MKKTIKGDSKLIRSWIFYDWANSSYPLVINTAIFPIFYEKITSAGGDQVQVLGMNFINTELYSYTIALSFILVSLSSPLLSGIADFAGRKKMFLKFFCYLGVISCASLYFFSKEHLGLSMLSVLFGSVGYWGSIVFYNAYLPEIAEPKDHDSISARGFSMGYFGAIILLVCNLIAIKVFGMNARYSFVSVAIWWVGFAQITFLNLPDGKKLVNVDRKIFFKGFHELKSVWDQLNKMKNLKRFLISFFIYSMGVQTVMYMAVLFAKKEIQGLEDSNLIISVLLIQFLGIAGAFLFSRASSRFGNIPVLVVALLIWISVCICTYKFVYTPMGFYIIAANVGLVMGGIQSLSRSTYSKLLPATEDHASFFSFYDVCEKIGIVIGMLSFGLIEGVTGGMRNSILSLIVFFIVGLIILLTVPRIEKAGDQNV